MGYQHKYEKTPVQDVHTPGIGLPGAWITILVRAIFL